MRKILNILVILLSMFILSSCNFEVNTDVDETSTMSEIVDAYEALVKKKSSLEKKISELEASNTYYSTEIEKLKENVSSIDDQINEILDSFLTLENEILNCAVIITHQEVDFSIFGTSSSNSLGSGFIISEDDTFYYALTNNHVVAQDSSSSRDHIFIYDYNLKKYNGTVMFSDANYDMALVKFYKSASLGVIKLAESNPSIGEICIAIGHPKRQVNSIGFGKVKKYMVPNYDEKDSTIDYEMIYHSAYMLSGNSGGMLINQDYEVVGINTLGTTTSNYEATVGLASPVLKIKEFLSLNSFEVAS